MMEKLYRLYILLRLDAWYILALILGNYGKRIMRSFRGSHFFDLEVEIPNHVEIWARCSASNRSSLVS